MNFGGWNALSHANTVCHKSGPYVAGSCVAGLAVYGTGLALWKSHNLAAALFLFPVIYWIYHSYRIHRERLNVEKKHVEEMTGLHLRTIEALALAIEPKECATRGQLRRVELYAMEIGKDLGLTDPELQGLRAAAILHDIGTLAVPEHIVFKPGRLTAGEFEKMKIHPIVGAEILEKVKFPYPVAPIVRAHHEKWDGTGYPAGLSGEDIPLTARILSAVDCLDALTSDRQYRQSIAVEDAMNHICAESGKSFDPRVVRVLTSRYPELERLLLQGEPASTAPETAAAPSHFLSSIAAARHEAQTLFELTRELGSSLNLDETLSVMALRLKRLCPYDSIAVYIKRGNKLCPEYANGENFRLLSALETTVGKGLSGRVAENRKPIVNGNPSAEPGYFEDAGTSSLQSALAAPLEGLDGLVGVLTLYRAPKDAFTHDDLRILTALTHKVALSIENALRFQRAESCATNDALTGLPNARSLFLHLDGEIARCKRQHGALTVMVCGLDGFKQINDRFGHLEGDKVLQTVAKRLRESCREYDYIARMGGDEFVVVLPGHPASAVEAKARQLSEIVVEAGLLHCGAELLSLSIGEAVFLQDGADAERLLTEADRRMYQSKQAHKMRKQLAGLRELASQ